MKHLASLLILMIFSLEMSSSGQNIKYAYDAAGNRIKREIVLQTRTNPQNEAKKESYSEMLSQREIRIYPNPTDGQLKVEISNLDQSDECNLSIFNANGQNVQSVKSKSSVAEFDISNQPKGIYILVILINGEKSTWKIIKK